MTTRTLGALLTDQHELERELEQHRGELTGYCYRMLGSPFEAEDAVQETLVRAWRGLERFEGRSTLRSWLYRIATNVCVDMLSAGRRRALPMDLTSSSPGGSPLGPPLPEDLWLGPIPDGRVVAGDADPAERAVARESIRLAFVAALQHLAPRQRAVLILRDVLRWRASEVADLLGTSTVSVNSLLRRARATLAAANRAGTDAHVAPDDEAARLLVDRYVDAFERFDVAALVALLHDDVVLSMPPFSLWVQGKEAVRAWLLASSEDCRRTRFVPVAANGGPAVASYRPTGVNGIYAAFSIQVVETSTAGIVGLHSFIDDRLFPLFGIPLELAG